MSFHWQRVPPDISPAGDAAEDQISDALSARWATPLPVGYAVITRTYYVVERDGRQFVEANTEYAACDDLNDPGSSEAWSDGRCVEVAADPTDETVAALAVWGGPPYGFDEWNEVAPPWLVTA